MAIDTEQLEMEFQTRMVTTPRGDGSYVVRPVIEEAPQWISVQEAAKRVRRSTRWIRYHVRNGNIEGKQLGGENCKIDVSLRSLLEFDEGGMIMGGH